jgi:hypothetical protein
MTLRSWILVAGTLGALCLAEPARAQSSSDAAALAEALYRQARDLMAEKRYAEACPKFAESQRLDPATGTLLNLAACHEAMGKLATAWLEYSEGLLSARRDQREDRVRYVEEQLRALEPRLSMLTITVDPAADSPALEIRLNGALIGAAARGVPAPVDPGTHVIEATAPGKKPWRQEFAIAPEADRKAVTVPLLEDAPVTAPAAPVFKALPAAAGADTELRADRPASRPLTAPIYIAGGVTLALTSGAVITGITYMNRKNDFDRANKEDPNASEANTKELRDRASDMSTINAVFSGAALAGAVVTGILFVTRPEERHSSAHPIIAPWLGASSGGVLLQGRL